MARFSVFTVLVGGVGGGLAIGFGISAYYAKSASVATFLAMLGLAALGGTVGIMVVARE